MSKRSNLMCWRKQKAMKFLAVIFTLALVALILPTNTWAAGAETFHFSFKGQSAEAFFSSIDPSGCIETDVGIFAVDGRVKQTGKPETTSQASIFISQYDFCNSVQLIAADGFANLADRDFQIDKKLNSATLNTTIEVFDFVSNTSLPPVDVSMNWTGIGGPFRSKVHFQAMTPGFKVNTHSDGTFHNAEVSGSVTDGTTNFTPELGFADLQSLKSGEVDINHF